VRPQTPAVSVSTEAARNAYDSRVLSRQPQPAPLAGAVRIVGRPQRPATRLVHGRHMDDYFLRDVSTRTRLVVAFCALAVFVGCVVLFVMLWPIVINGVAPWKD
jgi:hypothetical protein